MSTAGRLSSTVTRRYATALLDLAEEKGVLDKVETDFTDFQNTITKSEDLQAFIRNPLISQSDKKQVFDAICKKASFQKITNDFIDVLIRNKRIVYLESIVKAVLGAFADRRGEKKAHVKIAQDLTDAQRKELEKNLEKAAGAPVVLEIEVDPSILGGMIVTMDSTMIDDSVARKLERLKSAMGRGANVNTNLKEVG